MINQQRNAFTLIELSVVIAIIGLMVGTIMGGHVIMKGQELRSVGNEATRIMIATNQFIQKYGYPPGDMPNATAMWGNATGGAVGANCSNAGLSTPGTGTATCNGDGSGQISRFVSNQSSIGETWRAWQHLANAGIIKGKYSGVGYCWTSYPYCSIVASSFTPPVYYYHWTFPMNMPDNSWLPQNVPKGPLRNSVFTWLGITQSHDPTDTSNASSAGFWSSGVGYSLYPGDYTNALALGEHSIPDSMGALMKPEEVLQIDQKFDDGKPGTGGLRVNGNSMWTGTICTTGDITAPATSEYDLTVNDVTCTLIFMRTFASSKAASR